MLIAGVDEAGRGPLAGPVVAAAVILNDARRIKGLRLVTAFGLAAMLGTMPEVAGHGLRLITLASGFALWASVSEARPTRFESTRDLVLLSEFRLCSSA